MDFLYTATKPFDSRNEEKPFVWEEYIAWSGLTHLIELVSLDSLVSASLVEPDFNNNDDWKSIHTDAGLITGFYTSSDYVLRKVKDSLFNLLAVVIEPEQNCRDIRLDGYEFLGYELLDIEFGISALTNCGDLFAKTFLPSETNQVGLIDQYEQAKDIQKRLLENHPEEHHARTKVIAVWRHRTIGR